MPIPADTRSLDRGKTVETVTAKTEHAVTLINLKCFGDNYSRADRFYFVDMDCNLYGKQVIHGYLFLHHVVVAVVDNAVSRYHDKMKCAFVLRKLLVCI